MTGGTHDASPCFILPVLVLGRHEAPFHYAFSQQLKPGTLVSVPLRKRSVLGVVWFDTEERYEGPLKSIEQVWDLPCLSAALMKFFAWVGGYTMTPLGLVVRMGLGFLDVPLARRASTRKGTSALQAPLTVHPLHLEPQQKEVADQLSGYAAEKVFKPCVLEGVTGSGKTEVYFSVLQSVHQRGGAILILLPEIALNSHWVDRFRRYFHEEIFVWHSDLTPQQKRDGGRKIMTGQVRIVVGTRSALFLPFPKLDLIVVDEEHDPSYKQDEGIIYHARDMAVVRAHLEGCVVLLCSATPSFETRYNVAHKGYHHFRLTARYGQAHLPQIDLIDLRHTPMKPSQSLTPVLEQAVRETIARGEQVLLFLNRRGYAPVVFCGKCRQRILCDQCSAGRIYHRRYHVMVCHHCGQTDPLPSCCPLCGEDHALVPLGLGIERVAEEVKRLFPEARTLLVSSDTASSARKAEKLLQSIHHHEVDLIIGTQMMAKGHHFPLITLVGVMSADLGLWSCDFRAMEKTYQMVTQVAGRAGRSSKPGRVLIQTDMPDHPLMQALKGGQHEVFFDEEERQRHQWHYPPFGRFAALILSSADEKGVQECCRALTMEQPQAEGVEILGPIPAPLSLLRGQYRWRFLVKSPKTFPIQGFLKEWVRVCTKRYTRVKISIDIDPYTFF